MPDVVTNTYDKAFAPPAPVLQILVANSSRSHPRETLPALLDTGADVTAIPSLLVECLRLYPIGRLQIEDVHSNLTQVFTYAVQISVAGVTIPRIEVVLTDLEFVVVGRDVLNEFYIHFNGPELTFELSTST